MCQGLDRQTLLGKEHHVLEGPPLFFVCQVVNLDLREGDEALGHPHKLHIHLRGEGQHRSRLDKDTASRYPIRSLRDEDLKQKHATDVH